MCLGQGHNIVRPVRLEPTFDLMLLCLGQQIFRHVGMFTWAKPVLEPVLSKEDVFAHKHNTVPKVGSEPANCWSRTQNWACCGILTLKLLNMSPELYQLSNPAPPWKRIWASAWDCQQCGMCGQQRLRPACAYAQTDQSLASRFNILCLLNYWPNLIWGFVA